MTFRTAQKALASFKEFVNAAQSRVVRGLFAFSPVSPPVAALFLAPPWPNRTFYTIIGGISEFLIYLLCFQFFLKRKTGVERLEKWLTRSVYAAVGSFALYLILWNCFFYQLPNYWNMDIGGFVYNEGTITILSNPEGQD